ncbi:MAG: DNA mismatch repair endonuclease MutL [Synergistaceae bacterium]|jgi:DNA mismatch repair protein MutL|nr:DNA mismatch repair endonuclease MutL [Synergistaceae bacterium]
MNTNIKLLSESVWSRIAAGEVVERPASAVKEMVENSLDAGARRIRVRLWDGGRVRIVVEDDGAGIAFEELPLALTPHATSKIGGIEDLEAIHTLGYRGEALASLAAVAGVEIHSRPAGESGGLIRARGGRVSDHMRTNCTPGTRVQVDSLFENLPARRKFLKSAAGELRRAAAILREYAICRPEVGFSLEHDGRPVFSTDGSGDRRRAVEQLWGAEPPVSAVEAAAGHVALECWWQPRGHAARSDVVSFVNGRSVTDPLVKGAVNAAARELAGGWALFFSIDPSLVDVNIHPAKAEIRFRYPGDVFDAVKEAAAKLGAPARYVQGGGQRENRENPPPRAGGWDFKSGPAPVREKTDFPSPSTSTSHSHAPSRSPSSSYSMPAHAARPDRLFGRVAWPEEVRDEIEVGVGIGAGVGVGVGVEFGGVGERAAAEPPFPAAETGGSVSGGEAACPLDSTADAVYLGQLSSGYLVFDTPAGAEIVDPHAAHERVAFERVRAAAAAGMRAQPLLIPALLPPTLQLEAQEQREFLESVGFSLEALNGGLQLTAVPGAANALFSAVPPEALLRASLAALRDAEGASPEAAGPVECLWRSWAATACKEAVKVTTRLRPEEALALWRDLHRCRQPFFCPHGRPTVLEISVSELEKHFGRE